MRFEDAVAARRSVRSFDHKPVPRAAVERAIGLAVQAPAPHHSSPWRFSLIDGPEEKAALSAAMGAAWRTDLRGDGLSEPKIEAILGRSHGLLTGAPLLTVCSVDMSKAHDYPDERRRLAEWSLFAHSTGAALQTYMVALREEGIASCWISAPVFCRDVVKAELSLPSATEPQALVLAGYASADHSFRPRPPADPGGYILS